jgi:hypothetical protein
MAPCIKYSNSLGDAFYNERNFNFISTSFKRYCDDTIDSNINILLGHIDLKFAFYEPISE